jgi:hypothetical protein
MFEAKLEVAIDEEESDWMLELLKQNLLVLLN